MTENELTYNPKSRAFSPMRVTCAVQRRWGEWCRSKADSPTLFRNWLADHGIYVDWHTASRWWHGKSKPSAARIAQLVAAGATNLLTFMFQPAILAGDRNAREARISEIEAELERERNELRALDADANRLPD